MSSQYDEMQGDAMDAKKHPDRVMPPMETIEHQVPDIQSHNEYLPKMNRDGSPDYRRLEDWSKSFK